MFDYYLQRPAQRVASRDVLLDEPGFDKSLNSDQFLLSPQPPVKAELSTVSDLFIHPPSQWSFAPIERPPSLTQGPHRSWRPPAMSFARACYTSDGLAAWPVAEALAPTSASTSPSRTTHGSWVETVELSLRTTGDGKDNKDDDEGLGTVHRRAFHFFMSDFCKSVHASLDMKQCIVPHD